MALRSWKPQKSTDTSVLSRCLLIFSLSVNGSLVVGVCVIFRANLFGVSMGMVKHRFVATNRYDLGVQPDQFLFNKLISICAKSKVRFGFLTSCLSVESVFFYCEFFWTLLLNWQEGLSESQHFGSDDFVIATELANNSLEFVGPRGTCLEACANGVYFQMC